MNLNKMNNFNKSLFFSFISFISIFIGIFIIITLFEYNNIDNGKCYMNNTTNIIKNYNKLFPDIHIKTFSIYNEKMIKVKFIYPYPKLKIFLELNTEHLLKDILPKEYIDCKIDIKHKLAYEELHLNNVLLIFTIIIIFFLIAIFYMMVILKRINLIRVKNKFINNC